eukprot:5361139-Amphidinium_carterae.1
MRRATQESSLQIAVGFGGGFARRLYCKHGLGSNGFVHRNAPLVCRVQEETEPPRNPVLVQSEQ